MLSVCLKYVEQKASDPANRVQSTLAIITYTGCTVLMKSIIITIELFLKTILAFVFCQNYINQFVSIVMVNYIIIKLCWL